MKILWLTWKDRSHPLAGGAETVSGEIIDRLIRDGHELKMITAKYENAKKYEIIKGLEVYRVGNRYNVYLKAKKLYKKQLNNWADVVIDEMNTIPFVLKTNNQTKNILFCHQLAREVWFYQMVFPFSLIGYFMEPIMLWLLRNHYTNKIVVSSSTKKDLERYGFKNIDIIHEGINIEPIKRITPKQQNNIILSFGAIRPMKQTLHAVMAFETARDNNSQLKMVVAGDDSGKYASKVKQYISNSRHSSAIEVAGRVSIDQKLNLMRQANIILVTSVKEGWGLIVTEANSQGTPAIGYDVDGLRDSINDKVTGVLSPSSNYNSMGDDINCTLSNTDKYENMRTAAWEFSKEFTFENSYRDFLRIIKSETGVSE